MVKFKLEMQKYPLITAFLTLLICFGLFRLPVWGQFGETTQLILQRVFAVLILFALIYIIAGKSQILFSTKGMGYAFLAFSGYLAIFIVISIMPIVAMIYLDQPVSPNIIYLFIRDGFLFLLVGLFEEGLFRGLFFNALLAHWGSRRSGVIWSVIVSALIFGFIHVYREFFTLQILDPLIFSNALLKILEVACLGFPLAVIYLRTENLWAVAILHALIDFITDFYSILYENGVVLLDSYALSGEEGILAAFAYLIVILLLLIPTLIIAPQLKRVPLPQRGFFREIWTPRKVNSYF